MAQKKPKAAAETSRRAVVPGKKGRLADRPLDSAAAEQETAHDHPVAKLQVEANQGSMEAASAEQREQFVGRAMPPFSESLAARELVVQEAFAEGVRLPEQEEQLLDAWYGQYGTDVMRATLQDPAERTRIAERIFWPDDRTRISPTRAYPYRCICSLVITAGNGQRFVGTGWLASPRTVITAGHCVYMHPQGGWAERVDVFPGRDGSSTPRAFTTRNLHSVTGWIRHKRSESDYGALILDEPIGDEVGYFGYANLGDGELRNLTVNVVGYPGDKTPGTLWGHARRLKLAEPEVLVYENDTYGGQSGAPVIAWEGADKYYAVGIHNYGDLRGNLATRITKGVLDAIRGWS